MMTHLIISLGKRVRVVHVCLSSVRQGFVNHDIVTCPIVAKYIVDEYVCAKSCLDLSRSVDICTVVDTSVFFFLICGV